MSEGPKGRAGSNEAAAVLACGILLQGGCRQTGNISAAVQPWSCRRCSNWLQPAAAAAVPRMHTLPLLALWINPAYCCHRLSHLISRGPTRPALPWATRSTVER